MKPRREGGIQRDGDGARRRRLGPPGGLVWREGGEAAARLGELALSELEGGDEGSVVRVVPPAANCCGLPVA